MPFSVLNIVLKLFLNSSNWLVKSNEERIFGQYCRVKRNYPKNISKFNAAEKIQKASNAMACMILILFKIHNNITLSIRRSGEMHESFSFSVNRIILFLYSWPFVCSYGVQSKRCSCVTLASGMKQATNECIHELWGTQECWYKMYCFFGFGKKWVTQNGVKCTYFLALIFVCVINIIIYMSIKILRWTNTK